MIIMYKVHNVMTVSSQTFEEAVIRIAEKYLDGTQYFFKLLGSNFLIPQTGNHRK